MVLVSNSCYRFIKGRRWLCGDVGCLVPGMEDVRPRLCLSELLAGVEDGMMSLPTGWRLTTTRPDRHPAEKLPLTLVPSGKVMFPGPEGRPSLHRPLTTSPVVSTASPSPPTQSPRRQEDTAGARRHLPPASPNKAVPNGPEAMRAATALEARSHWSFS